MNALSILVVNGSPKGENSITLQMVRYLEKDFTPSLEVIGRADVLLFSYPVYTFIASLSAV